MASISTVGLIPASVFSDDGVATTSLPVVAGSTTYRTILRLATPVLPGDVLTVYADARVTNDVGVDPVSRKVTGVRYTVGVGYHLWSYNASAPAGPVRDATWAQIGSSMGENVTVDGHHLALNIGRVWQVPADWNPGDQAGIALRGAAMSTAWNSNAGADVITVDPYGCLIVNRWTVPF